MDITIYALIFIVLLGLGYLMFFYKDRFDKPRKHSKNTISSERKAHIEQIAQIINKEEKIVKETNNEEEEVIIDYDNQLLVSSSPHVFSNATTRKIMKDVVIALLPATLVSFVFFGLNAILIVLLCVVSSVVFEWGFQKVLKRPNTISDFSAVVTGLLLALNLPAVDFKDIWWPCVVGSLVAIVVVKGIFGGLGKNFANPAITARVILLLAFSGTIASSVHPAFGSISSGATPLPSLANGGENLPQLWEMVVGLRGGALGETSTIALLIGGIYLIAKKVITWHTPVIYILAVFVLSFIIKSDLNYALYQMMSGGLFIGAFFMATDYVTTPTRPFGRVIFALGCALITVAIRVWGSYPEGVSFSILFMNILTPYIDKLTTKRPFGGIR